MILYVKDTARVCVEIMKKLRGAVNIGSGKVHSIKIVETLQIYDLKDKIHWDAAMPMAKTSGLVTIKG